ncbi:MAG: GNAT family N-acetyltransferase [Thermoanaerobaculaceae bacterium]|jgi:GNAT superfamily N-acetyltransferase
MSHTPVEVTVRPARPEDLPSVLKAVGRLGDFGPPSWRTAAELVEGEARAVRRFFSAPPAGAVMLVAEGVDGEPLGFVYLERTSDYFTEEAHGHVSIIAVAAHAEGRGVAGALMKAAETWAREAGFGRLTLTVFEGNHHARAVYERVGYRTETLRYVKLLR